VGMTGALNPLRLSAFLSVKSVVGATFAVKYVDRWFLATDEDGMSGLVGGVESDVLTVSESSSERRGELEVEKLGAWADTLMLERPLRGRSGAL
jgi:hypothetical protein